MRNINQERWETLKNLSAAMQAVYKANGVPVSTRLATNLIFAGASLGIIEKQIKATNDITKRKRLIFEFSKRKAILENMTKRLFDESFKKGSNKINRQLQPKTKQRMSA